MDMVFSPLKLEKRRKELNEHGKERKSVDEKRLTLIRAAELLGMHFTKLQRWEAGIANPKVDELSNVAKVYNVDINYFMVEK